MSAKVATYQSVSRNRMRASGAIMRRSLAKAITRAAHGVDQSHRVVVIDLAPQPPHEHFEHVGERIMIVVPDVRGDGGAIHYLAGVAHEAFEQREFLAGEEHG